MKRVVLVGAGHAHAQVLLDCAWAPLPGVEIVVVSAQAMAPYSGMVPGWLSGAYRFDEIVIDFVALCAIAGARWVEGELDTLDAPRRRLRLRTGEELAYDLLSLNVGSTVDAPRGLDVPVLALRPLSDLRPAYETLLAQWSDGVSDRPFTVTVVGGGAAGFESLLAVLNRLRTLRPDRRVNGLLITRGNTVLPGLAAPARRAAHKALSGADVTLYEKTEWGVIFARRSDLVLWASGAQAHPWQRDPVRRGTLAVSEQGFVRVDAQLRSISNPQVFAVGDCAHWATPLPKAGVYAVRMGPVLSGNLRAALGEGSARGYRPQRHFLALLATGDGRAIVSRGLLGTHGRWAWRWKDRIDREFIGRFPRAATGSQSATIDTPAPGVSP